MSKLSVVSIEKNGIIKVGNYLYERGEYMPQTMSNLIQEYVTAIRKIYGTHLKQVILYGSYARGDFKADSDVDIMLLVDLPGEKSIIIFVTGYREYIEAAREIYEQGICLEEYALGTDEIRSYY